MRLLVLLGVVSAASMVASDFCAVQLTIIDSSGKLTDAPVALIDQDGLVEQSVFAHGKLSLCDMKFGPHTIRVGNEKCSGYVTIHSVSLVYGLPRTFTVVANGCETPEMMTLPPSCQVNFRMISPDGTKLTQAEVVRESDPNIYRADRFGRFFLSVRNGVSESFTFTAPGYKKSETKVVCQRFETIERVVQMVPEQ
jgi:hypothetical protein